jgi:hypothetical protein
MQRIGFPRNLWQVIVLAGLAALLGGCLGGNANVTGPQVLSAMPQGWTPLSRQRGVFFSRNTDPIWTEINIDDDLASEYLLYFTYDNGQIGAIIYDQQAGASAVNSPTPLPAPNQPAGQYVPYQVEPSFWTRSDVPDTVGYIAPPGVTIDQLRVEQVQRFSAAETERQGRARTQVETNTPPNNELIIYGGSTVISVLWWRNTFNGYGVAQMEAGSVLQPSAREGDVLRPLETVIGQTPLAGLLARSVLCSEVRFTRTDTGEPADIVQPVYQGAVRYVESSGGIVFCDGAPAYPYYPEGVVLAFLRSAPAGATEAGAPPSNLLWSKLDDARRARMAALVDLNGAEVAGSPPLIVRDLRTRPTVPMPPDFRSSGGALTTNVCAEVVTEDGLVLRRLLFDLVYEPLQEAGGVITSERFAIANISDITGVFANCTLIIP